jgi:hypothetical protein
VECSVYDQRITSKTHAFLPELDETDCDSSVIKLLRSRGFRSVGLILLLEDGKMIALLEMGSPTLERIHATARRKLGDLLAPSAVAARREMDETTSAIAIKTHFTAIHPSVECRFEQAAYSYNTELATFEPIVFEDVYPLFGAMDIRGSLASRDQTIEADLLDQINLASDTRCDRGLLHHGAGQVPCVREEGPELRQRDDRNRVPVRHIEP